MFEVLSPGKAAEIKNMGNDSADRRIYEWDNRQQTYGDRPTGIDRRIFCGNRRQTSTLPIAAENNRCDASDNPAPKTATAEKLYGTLVQRNVYIDGIRTTMRLEIQMWDAFDEICQREAVPPNELLDLINEARQTGSLSSALRVYIVVYFDNLATERPSDTQKEIRQEQSSIQLLK